MKTNLHIDKFSTKKKLLYSLFSTNDKLLFLFTKFDLNLTNV